MAGMAVGRSVLNAWLCTGKTIILQQWAGQFDVYYKYTWSYAFVAQMGSDA